MNIYIYMYVQISHASQHHFAHTHTEIWQNTVDGLDIQPTSTSWHGESPMFALLFDIYVCLSICSIQGEYFLKVFFSRSLETLTGSIEASSHVKQLKISGIFPPKTLRFAWTQLCGRRLVRRRVACLCGHGGAAFGGRVGAAEAGDARPGRVLPLGGTDGGQWRLGCKPTNWSKWPNWPMAICCFLGVSLNGGFPQQPWGFPTKKWSLWGVLGVPPFKETPI